MKKRCTMCGKTYPRSFEYFDRFKYSRDGLKSECRECRRKRASKWRKMNPRKKRVSRKKDYSENRERYIKKASQWNKENRARSRVHHRKSDLRRWRNLEDNILKNYLVKKEYYPIERIFVSSNLIELVRQKITLSRNLKKLKEAQNEPNHFNTKSVK